MTATEMDLLLKHLYGALYVFISLASILMNGILIILLVRQKSRNTFTVLLLGLCSVDFFMSASGTFITGLAYLIGSYLLRVPVCQVQGVVMTFSGLSQIAVLSSISFTRYVIITNPNFRLRACHARRILYGCYGYCLAVAVCPVLGWNTYRPNEAGMSCEPVWDNNSRRDRSFNLFMIVTCFLFPLLIICVSYLKIALAVKRQSKLHARSRKLHVSYTILIMIAFFLLSWAPYTIYAVHQMATNTLSMGSNTVSIPGIFAKSSAMWNPIIYFLRDSEFRKMCRQRCGFYNFFFAKRRPVNLTRKETTLQCLVSSPERESQV